MLRIVCILIAACTLVSTAVFLTAANGAPSSPEPNGLDAQASVEAPTTAVVRFVLRNETGRPIYLQLGGHWSLLRGDQRVRAGRNCDICDCQDSNCWVCGMPLDETIAIEPEEEHAWEWEGLEWRLRTDVKPGVTCEKAEPAPAGPLVVQVHYSFSRSDADWGSVVGPIITLDQPFNHPPSHAVLLVAR